jgi:hypothetical protein
VAGKKDEGKINSTVHLKRILSIQRKTPLYGVLMAALRLMQGLRCLF